MAQEGEAQFAVGPNAAEAPVGGNGSFFDRVWAEVGQFFGLQCHLRVSQIGPPNRGAGSVSFPEGMGTVQWTALRAAPRASHRSPSHGVVLIGASRPAAV